MRNLFKIVRETYRIKFGKKSGVQFHADLLADQISHDIRTWCFSGQRHLQADHPANCAFNRILFYVSHPEYVQFIEEARDD